MRFFFVCAPVAALVLTVFACSETTVQTNTNPDVPEGGMELEDGAIVDSDGEVVNKPDTAKPSLVNVSTGTIDGFTESRTPYVVAVPKTYDASKKYPLVLVFHGDGGDGPSMRGYHTLDDASGNDAIVVYPTGKLATWDLSTPFDQNADQQYVEALIKAMKDKYSVDKVFGVGWSSGGFLVNILACRRAGIFAAFVSHAGGAPFEIPESKDADGFQICPNNPKYPVLITHGSADGTVEPGSGDFDAQHWAHYNGCNVDTNARIDTTPSPCKKHASCPAGKDVTFCLIPGNGHGIWSQAVPVEWAFLKSQ